LAVAAPQPQQSAEPSTRHQRAGHQIPCGAQHSTGSSAVGGHWRWCDRAKRSAFWTTPGTPARQGATDPRGSAVQARLRLLASVSWAAATKRSAFCMTPGCRAPAKLQGAKNHTPAHSLIPASHHSPQGRLMGSTLKSEVVYKRVLAEKHRCRVYLHTHHFSYHSIFYAVLLW
jgi:hypothetical protein